MLILDGFSRHSSSLRKVISEPGYAGRVIAIIQRLANASESGELLELLFDATETMGAHYAAFLSYIRDDFAHENFRFVLACDPRWCWEYKRRAPYSHDPWIHYASFNTEPICASQISGMTGEQCEVQALAERYGMRSTFVIPAPSAGVLSRVGMLALGSRHRGFFEGDGSTEFKVIARSLSMELQSWWLRQLRKEMIEKIAITPDELQLLAYERAGLGSKEIAAELATTIGSIDSRWQRLNRKLGTANRAASSRLAAEYGLI